MVYNIREQLEVMQGKKALRWLTLTNRRLALHQMVEAVQEL